MFRQPNPSDFSGIVVYVRRSSEWQKETESIDAQKQAIREAAQLRGLPEPILYEDDEQSVRGE